MLCNSKCLIIQINNTCSCVFAQYTVIHQVSHLCTNTFYVCARGRSSTCTVTLNGKQKYLVYHLCWFSVFNINSKGNKANVLEGYKYGFVLAHGFWEIYTVQTNCLNPLSFGCNCDSQNLPILNNNTLNLPGLGIFIHCPFGTPDGPQSRKPMKSCITYTLQEFKTKQRHTNSSIINQKSELNDIIWGVNKVKAHCLQQSPPMLLYPI